MTIRVPAGGTGVTSTGGGLLAAPVTAKFRIGKYNGIRMEQLLAQLGYLPLTWSPLSGSSPSTSDARAQVSAAYEPPAGTYTWQPATRRLTRLWRPDKPSLILKGAVMAFEADHHLMLDGVIGSQVWRAMFKALAKGRMNTHGYTYAVASQKVPETLTVWHNGQVIFQPPGQHRNTCRADSGGDRPGVSAVPDPDHARKESGRHEVCRPGGLGRVFPRRRGRALLPALLLRIAAEPRLRGAAVQAGQANLAVPDIRNPGDGHGAVASWARTGPDGATGENSRAMTALRPLASKLAVTKAGFRHEERTGGSAATCHPLTHEKELAVPADKLHITLAGREHVVEAGTTAGDALAAAAKAGDGGSLVAARVNGTLRDLAWQLSDGDAVQAVGAESPDGLAILRHSTAHVLAQAVQQIHPDAKLGIGPPVENGFYYDFDVAEPFSPADLKAIEQRMRQIVKQAQRFSRRVVSDQQARAELASEPYKLELIGIKGCGP